MYKIPRRRNRRYPRLKERVGDMLDYFERGMRFTRIPEE
jgi:hypothetical protein